MKRIVAIVAGIALVATLALQLVPPEFERDNPPSTAPISEPPAVAAILRNSCFDCHSNETVWPFYAWVAPASWLVAADVAGARSRLNFSDWETLRESRKRRHARRIVERIEAAEMPMPKYLWLHPSAVVTDDQLATLRAWRDSLEAPNPE